MNGKTWIPLVLGVLLQTAAIAWWASTMSSKLDEVAAETERQRQIIAENTETINKVKTIQEEFIKHNTPYQHFMPAPRSPYEQRNP